MQRLGWGALLCVALGGCGSSNDGEGRPDGGSVGGSAGNAGSGGSSAGNGNGSGGDATDASEGGTGTDDDGGTTGTAGTDGADAASPSGTGSNDPGGPLIVAEDESGASVCGQVGQVPWSVPIRQALAIACDGGDAREWYDGQKDMVQVRIEDGEVAMHIAITFRGEFDSDSLGEILDAATGAGGDIVDVGCSSDLTVEKTNEQRQAASRCESDIGSVLLIIDVTLDALPELLAAMDAALPSTSFSYLQAIEM